MVESVSLTDAGRALEATVAEIDRMHADFEERRVALGREYELSLADLEQEREESLAPLYDRANELYEQLAQREEALRVRLDEGHAALAGQRRGASPSSGVKVLQGRHHLAGLDAGDVLKALREIGRGNAKTIAERLDQHTLAVADALKELNRQGKVRGVTRGRYRDYEPL